MKKVWGLGAFLLILLGFLWREYDVAQLPVPMMVADKNVVLMRVDRDMVFGMGDLNSPRARTISRSLLSFFESGGLTDVWEIGVGQEIRGAEFLVQRVSDNLVRLVCVGQVVWWIGDDFSDEEKVVAVQSGVNFDSAWWVMSKNRLVDFLPLPADGIVFAGDRAPSKKTVEFAKDGARPLVAVRDTGGITLIYEEDGWNLNVRN